MVFTHGTFAILWAIHITGSRGRDANLCGAARCWDGSGGFSEHYTNLGEIGAICSRLSLQT